MSAKDPADKVTESLRVYVTPTERKAIEAAAAYDRRSLASYVRAVAAREAFEAIRVRDAVERAEIEQLRAAKRAHDRKYGAASRKAKKTTTPSPTANKAKRAAARQ